MDTDRRSQALIFDLDGVLLDTEPFYTEATQTIVGRFGKTFDWSIKANMIGRPSLDSARYLVDALSLPISAQQYLSERKIELERLFAGAREIKGAEVFVRRSAQAGVRQAVATSSERALFELKTAGHAKWFSLFDTVVCGDDPRVVHGKPAPDIFLVAAAELGVEPSRCLVFEDSPVGVRAALAAGMRVVAVPDAAMDRAAYADAHRVIGDFSGVVPGDFVA